MAWVTYAKFFYFDPFFKQDFDADPEPDHSVHFEAGPDPDQTFNCYVVLMTK